LKNNRLNQKQTNQSSDDDSSLVAPVIMWRINEWFSDLTTEQKSNLKKYHDELCKFNKVLNLVSPKSLYTADAIHFADSIKTAEIVLNKLNKNNVLHDIGSGNGFPGLVAGILQNDLRVVLVDVDQRKCEFLKHTISQLGLSNISVENKKIASFAENSIHQAIMRGFAPIPRAILDLRKTVSKGGVIYHMKSEEWSTEVLQIPSQLFSVWHPELVGQYSIPSLTHKMFVVKTDKIA
jgi:16S rRNA (guanine527-N7)-methyltransferase